MKQAANALTLVRVVLTGIVALFFLGAFFEETTTRILCAVVFLVAALTDLADGRIARQTGTVSDFGKFLDPVADKFLITASFICMAASAYFEERMRLVIAAVLIVIVLRDLSVTSLRLIAAGKGRVLSAARAGKIKTFVQCACVLWLLLEPVILPADSVLQKDHLISLICLAVCALCTLYSGAAFAAAYLKTTDKQSRE